MKLTLLSACAAPVQASQAYPGPPSIEHLARQADVVVIGDVTAATGELSATGAIQTRVSVAVRETLKGPASPALSFTHSGGRVGDQMSAIGGAARFSVGERVVAFLARQPDGGLRLSDIIHGRLRVERDAATGREYAVRSTGAPGADRFPLDQVRADVRRSPGG